MKLENNLDYIVKTYIYNEDTLDEKEALMNAFNISSEKYDEINKNTNELIKDFKQRFPLLVNIS
jgi:hypothetical protein